MGGPTVDVVGVGGLVGCGGVPSEDGTTGGVGEEAALFGFIQSHGTGGRHSVYIHQNETVIAHGLSF